VYAQIDIARDTRHGDGRNTRRRRDPATARQDITPPTSIHSGSSPGRARAGRFLAR
jgi:hypothetical protein